MTATTLKPALALGVALTLNLPMSFAQESVAPSPSIAVRTADAGGLKLQYLAAGRGPAVVLLHGYAETSRMWRPVIPRLAEHFTVIAPDLPGIGGSDIPGDGLDMKRAAIRIHDLVKGLGVQKAAVHGVHDLAAGENGHRCAELPANPTSGLHQVGRSRH